MAFLINKKYKANKRNFLFSKQEEKIFHSGNHYDFLRRSRNCEKVPEK